MDEEYLNEETYDFIGHIARALYEYKIKVSYTTLVEILKDNGLYCYGSERGVASAISAAHRRWKEKEQEEPPTSVAISETFIGATGEPAWKKYK